MDRPPPTLPRTPSWWASLAIAAGLVAVVLLVFGPVLGNGFVNWDDQDEIVNNPHLNPAVTAAGLAWNWTHTELTLYMPLTYYAWGAVAAVDGRDAGGHLRPAAFHGLNVALHATAAVLVFALLRTLWGRPWPAGVGAVAFAVHPLAVEPVAWASGMYTLLSTALSLAAVLAYLRHARRARDTGRGSAGWYAVATALYAAAVLCKAASVSTPLVAAVIDYAVVGRPLRRVVRSVVPWVLLAVPAVVAAKRFQDLTGVPVPPLWGRPVVAADAVGFYVRKLAWPAGLAPDYGRTPTWVMAHLAAAAATGGLAVAVGAVARRGRRRAPRAAAGVAVFVAATAPYLGLTTFDFQYLSTVADRYAYAGLTGVAMVAAAAVGRWRWTGVAVLAVAVAWGVCDRRQVGQWRDTTTLFDHTLAVNPDSLLARTVFGYLAARDGRRAEAEAWYRSALAVWPADATVQFDLGNLYLPDRPRLAAERYALAVRYRPGNALYHNNYGVALDRIGEAARAADQFRAAIMADPSYADPHVNLGWLLLSHHRPDLAAAEFAAAVRIDPASQAGRAGLAAVARGRPAPGG